MPLPRRNARKGPVLSASFYARPTLQVARNLLGKYLVRETSTGLRAARIVEVEAYIGFHDRASHASRGRTKRTEVMFGQPGLAYVYLIYGMHHCLNVVTERADFPAAVLIRAVQDETELIDGPGRICRSLEIDRELNYHDLTSGKTLWIEDRGNRIRRARIGTFPRIGVDYAGAWATKPWRFRLEGGRVKKSGTGPRKARRRSMKPA